LILENQTSKKGKVSFKEYTIVSAPSTPSLGNSKDLSPSMTPERWAEKDRLERFSIESQTAYKGIIELAVGFLEHSEGNEIISADKLGNAVNAALNWAMSHFKAEAEVKGTKQEDNPDLATDAQRKKIFATMKEYGYTEEHLEAWVVSQYGKESTKDLTKKEASEIIEAIQECKIPTGEKQEDLFEEGGENR